MILLALHNGTREPASLIEAVMADLRGLAVTNPPALRTLVAHCRDPRRWPLVGLALEGYRGFGFVNPHGQIHGPVRNIVASAAVGEGPKLRLIDPVTKQQGAA